MRIIYAAMALCLCCTCAGSADRLTAELQLAAEAGDNEAVGSLIASGAKVNAKAKGGMTPLTAGALISTWRNFSIGSITTN